MEKPLLALELKPAWLHSPRTDSSPAGHAPAPVGQPNPPTGPAFSAAHSHHDGPWIRHGPTTLRWPSWEPALRSRYTGAALPFSRSPPAGTPLSSSSSRLHPLFAPESGQRRGNLHRQPFSSRWLTTNAWMRRHIAYPHCYRPQLEPSAP